MGTRNLTMVIKDGKTKVAQYGQFDGYLSCAGKTILESLKKYNHEFLKEKIDKVSFYTEKEEKENWINFAKRKGIDPNEHLVEISIMNEFNSLYPTLDREIGYNIINMIANSTEPLKLRDESEFAKDSLFCEFCYVVDFDKNTFEIYKGFNKKALTPTDRFYYLQDLNEEYKPVKLLKEYNLDNLPTEEDFLSLDED